MTADEDQTLLELAPGLFADAPAGRRGARVIHPGTHLDRSGGWLRNAAAGLGVLAGAAAAVSFTAQYRMIFAARRLALVAGLEAAIPDAAAVVFASLGIALALHGKRAIRARALNVASVAVSVFMNAIAASPGWRGLAIWAMPPVAYGLASDTLIGVVRAWAIARHEALDVRLADEQVTPLAVLGGLALWLLRLALAPGSTLAGFRRWVIEECPVAPGRRLTARRPRAGDHRAPARCRQCPARSAERHEDGPVPRPGDRAPRTAGGRAGHGRGADIRGAGTAGRSEHRGGQDSAAQGSAGSTQRESSMKYVIILAVVLTVAALWKWAFLPGRGLPRHRVRHTRFRLHLRLHPGRGFATVGELWLRWGRLAALRKSGRIRRSLSAWQRMRRPRQHSVRVGRAHYRHRLQVPLEEHLLLIAPPRTFKTAFLAHVILRYPGPVISTTTKADVFGLTSGVRAAQGPVHVFNPQGIGGVASTFRWSPVDGCQEHATAIRRADAFAQAVSQKGVEDGTFWSAKASDYMRAYFHAAAQMSRIASHASFGSSREHALPAAQRVALRCRRPSGPPRGCSDLGLHGLHGSDATMMRLIPLRGLHHHCACWHHDASGSSRLHRVHHRRTRQAVPGRTAAARDAPGLRIIGHVTRLTWQPAALVAPDASPRPGDGCSRGRQLARRPRGTPTCRHAADVAARVAVAGRWTLLAWTCNTAAEIHTRNHQPGSSLQAPRSG